MRELSTLKSGGRFLRVLFVGVLLAFLAGCAATQVAISKKNLDVQTKTSTAIFVDEVARNKRTIYVNVRSGVMEFDRRAFKKFIKEQFAQSDSGYSVVDNPETAHFTMSIYVLNLEKASPSAAESALNQGYTGTVLAGAAAGAVISRNRNPYAGAAIGGLLAAGISTIANAAVKDVTYMLVADVQIKEKTRKGVIVRKDTQISAKVSDAGSSTQRVSEVSNRKEYRTRIVTTANKVNLKLEEAQDLMFKKTAYAMAGFF